MLDTGIANRLVMWRSLRGLSQRRLAKDSGVSVSAIAEIENGHAKDVMLSTVLNLCTAFGVSPDYFLGFEEKPFVVRRSSRPTVREARDGIRVCEECGRTIARGELHLPWECVIYAHETMELSTKQLAVKFGHSVLVIETILNDGYGRRIGKRRPPVTAA